jgi:hypothetical protein
MLAAGAAAEAETIGWWRNGFLASFGLAIVSASLVVFWLRRVSSLSVTKTVRALDTHWAMQARLESTLELAKVDSPLAASLREETGRKVADKTLPSGWLWITTLVCVSLMGLFLLSEYSVGLFGTAPGKKATASKTTEENRNENSAAGAKSSNGNKTSSEVANLESYAEIKWISPEAKSRATAIEEVWLKAAVETRSGLRNVSLEISVNGGTPETVPVSEATGARVAHAGTYEIEQAIYLDELSVKDYDVVSYFLRAEPVSEKAATITSPLQFIQIRAASEEVSMGSNNENDGSEIASLLYRLQSVQLDLLQQNFLLAKAGISHAENIWHRTNLAVAAQQSELAFKTGDLRTLVIAQAGPAMMVDHLGQAATLMTQASGQLNTESNNAAISIQQQALALLADCDRLFHKSLRGKQTAADPFHDKQKFTLPERNETPAGELEALAQKQDQILNELAGAAGQTGTAIPGNTKASEDNVTQEAARLGNGDGLSGKTKQATRRAAEEAKTAAQRMGAGDAKGALAPATAAAQALHDALREQETSGRLEALEALEAARRELNILSRLDEKAARTARILEAATELERAAELQQRTGLADAARQMTMVANGTQLLVAAAPGGEAWQAEVRQAAAAQVVIATQRDAVRRATRQLERGKSAVANPGITSGRADIELAAQIARELFPEASLQETARALEVAAASQSERAPGTTALSAQCDPVLQALVKLRTEGERDERVRRFNANEIDPAYRPSVEDYFERLSREGTAR